MNSKDKILLVFGIIISCLLIAVAYGLNEQIQATGKLAKQVKDLEQERGARQSLIDEHRDNISNLRAAIGELTQIIQNDQREHELVLEVEKPTSEENYMSEEEWAKQKQLVPAPLVMVDKYGKRKSIFPKLLSPQNEVLMQKAEYRGHKGMRLTFKQADKIPITFLVNELHPGVLVHLGMDSNELRKEENLYIAQRRSRRIANAKILAFKEKELRSKEIHNSDIRIKISEAHLAQAEAFEAAQAGRRHRLEGEATLRSARAQERLASAAIISAINNRHQGHGFIPITQPIIQNFNIEKKMERENP